MHTACPSSTSSRVQVHTRSISFRKRQSAGCWLAWLQSGRLAVHVVSKAAMACLQCRQVEQRIPAVVLHIVGWGIRHVQQSQLQGAIDRRRAAQVEAAFCSAKAWNPQLTSTFITTGSQRNGSCNQAAEPAKLLGLHGTRCGACSAHAARLQVCEGRHACQRLRGHFQHGEDAHRAQHQRLQPCRHREARRKPAGKQASRLSRGAEAHAYSNGNQPAPQCAQPEHGRSERANRASGAAYPADMRPRGQRYPDQSPFAAT